MIKFKISCTDCPFTGTYRTRALAERALRMHSCEWQRKQAAARARGAARRAAVDRTPKPCHHKIANHQHGTRACYTLDRCRCLPCTEAVREAYRSYRRLHAYGRYDRYVDADQAREHVRQLMAQGMGLDRITQVSGVAHGTMWKLLYGKPGPDGTPVPSRRVLRETHDRLIATRVDLADGALDPFGTARARRQLQALVALGWSMSTLGGRLGVAVGNTTRLVHGDSTLQAGTVRAIAALYAELSDRRPPETTGHQRAVASRARRYAKARGWLLPIELDLIEDPAPVDDTDEDGGGVDWVAVERRMAGDKSVRLSKAERVELVRRWLATGRPNSECERLTGIPVYRYLNQARNDAA